jgi:hypothetical protein
MSLAYSASGAPFGFLKGAAQPLSEFAFDFLGHPHDWEHFTVAKRHLQIFQRGIAFRAIKRDAARRRSTLRPFPGA